jgi:hypothetical protein
MSVNLYVLKTKLFSTFYHTYFNFLEFKKMQFPEIEIVKNN